MSDMMDAAKTKVKLKALQRIREKLSDPNCAVLVEGKHDKDALRRAGFGDGNVIAVSGRKPEAVLDSLVHELKLDSAEITVTDVDSIVILMDFDESGRKLAKRWIEAVSGYGIAVDSDVPKKMRWVLGIKTVEDLPSALERFEEKCKRC